MQKPLTIRPEQWEKFGQNDQAQFVERMVVHLRALLRTHPISADLEAMNALVEWGLQFTERLGIERRCDVVKFLELFVHADLDFPKALKWAWIRNILSQLDRPAAHRLEDVYGRLIVEGQRHGS